MSKELQKQRMPNEVHPGRSAGSIFKKHFMEPVKKYVAAGMVALALANGGCATTISVLASREANGKHLPPADVACGVLVDLGAAGGGTGFGYWAKDIDANKKTTAGMVIAGVVLGALALGSIPCGIALGPGSGSSSTYQHDPIPGAAQQQFIQKQQQQHQQK